MQVFSNVKSFWVQDDPKLPGDSGGVSVSKWSGWQFDFRYEIFSLLDGKKMS